MFDRSSMDGQRQDPLRRGGPPPLLTRGSFVHSPPPPPQQGRNLSKLRPPATVTTVKAKNPQERKDSQTVNLEQEGIEEKVPSTGNENLFQQDGGGAEVLPQPDFVESLNSLNPNEQVMDPIVVQLREEVRSLTSGLDEMKAILLKLNQTPAQQTQPPAPYGYYPQPFQHQPPYGYQNPYQPIELAYSQHQNPYQPTQPAYYAVGPRGGLIPPTAPKPQNTPHPSKKLNFHDGFETPEPSRAKFTSNLVPTTPGQLPRLELPYFPEKPGATKISYNKNLPIERFRPGMNFTKWVPQFICQAQALAWSRPEQLANLFYYVEAAAFQPWIAIIDPPERAKDPVDLLNELQANHATRVPPETILKELRETTQKPEESVTVYANRIRSCYAQLDKADQDKKQLLQLFIRGLRKRLQERVVMEAPNDIGTAVKIAADYDAMLFSIYGAPKPKGDKPTPAPSTPKPPKHAATPTPAAGTTPATSTPSRGTRPSDDRYKKQCTRHHADPNVTKHAAWACTDLSIECYTCKQKGHTSYACPTSTCGSCKSKGHTTKVHGLEPHQIF